MFSLHRIINQVFLFDIVVIKTSQGLSHVESLLVGFNETEVAPDFMAEFVYFFLNHVFSHRGIVFKNLSIFYFEI